MLCTSRRNLILKDMLLENFHRVFKIKESFLVCNLQSMKLYEDFKSCNNIYKEPCKGQLISRCPVGVFKSPRKPTKLCPGFLPQPLKRGQIKKQLIKQFINIIKTKLIFLIQTLFRGWVRNPCKIFVGFLGDLKTPKRHFIIN